MGGIYTYDNDWIFVEGFDTMQFLARYFGETKTFEYKNKLTRELWLGKEFFGKTYLLARFAYPTLKGKGRKK